MSLFIVIIMTLSVLGFMVNKGSGDQVKYNNFKFVTKGNKWVIKINNNEVGFDYLPSQVENINVTDDVIEAIKRSVQIDMTSYFDSKYKENIAEAQFGIERALLINNQFVRYGFTTENEFNFTVIGCEDATNYVPVLVFEESNETVVYREGNCVILKAKSEQDVIALKDRILYGVFGIIGQNG